MGNEAYLVELCATYMRVRRRWREGRSLHKASKDQMVTIGDDAGDRELRCLNECDSLILQLSTKLLLSFRFVVAHLA